jgi:hypothetical protein
MEDASKIINLVLKAVALGMGVASIVMGFLPQAANVNTQVTLLSIGLSALALAALQKEEQSTINTLARPQSCRQEASARPTAVPSPWGGNRPIW